MSFHIDTPEKVCNVLLSACNSTRNQRLILRYGDTQTGRDWGEIYDTTGYVGRSTGTYKIPLLIPKSNSFGGGGILDHCIVRIYDAHTKQVLYSHDNYKPVAAKITTDNVTEGYTHAIEVDGKLWSRHKSLKSANLYLKRLNPIAI